MPRIKLNSYISRCMHLKGCAHRGIDTNVMSSVANRFCSLTLAPMSTHTALTYLLSNNTQWAEKFESANPGFSFQKSASECQRPPVRVSVERATPLIKFPIQVLWIGCSDSRVPESVITNAKPGDIFVHRNIAKSVLSPLSSVVEFDISFASQVHLPHNISFCIDSTLAPASVVVVGHSECGGAKACLDAAQNPSVNEDGSITTIPSLPRDAPLNRWLAPLTRFVASLQLSGKPTKEALPVVVEGNIKMQVENLCKTQTMSNAWASKKKVWVHGWLYDLATGRLKDLEISRGPAS